MKQKNPDSNLSQNIQKKNISPAAVAMLKQEAKLVTNARIIFFTVFIIILFLSALQSG